ncbi:ATP-binding protein [Jiangella alkaliphila]|uniref:ATP-binding protein n=1 Tax=Jiangella alkaliphila TaxID=419479 RepID=UPI0022AB26A0|nr:ATP-binding protein [Jiangella alkaliphila]
MLGPRGCGKTTTARRMAAATVALDDPRQAAAFHLDPSAALAALRPAYGTLLIDEWQEVPAVLGAVKRAVDTGAGPGSFVLTGSVHAALEGASWAGTGRTVHVDMYPLTEAERQGRGDAVRPEELLFSEPASAPSGHDLTDYLVAALVGGYPATFGLDDRDRQLWLRSFADQLVTRDAAEAEPIRDLTALRRLFRVLAEYSGAIVDDSEIARAVGIDVRTVRGYQRVLTDLRVVDSLPAWHDSRISRLVKAPKRYLVDSGLAAALLGVDLFGVLRRGDIVGHLLETFVIAQLRSLFATADGDWRLHHLRVQDGRHEIDVIAEAADGGVVAIEIKATAAPAANDARHIAWLRATIGQRFRQGIVYHTGTLSMPLGERITARPISTLWAA